MRGSRKNSIPSPNKFKGKKELRFEVLQVPHSMRDSEQAENIFSGKLAEILPEAAQRKVQVPIMRGSRKNSIPSPNKFKGKKELRFEVLQVPRKTKGPISKHGGRSKTKELEARRQICRTHKLNKHTLVEKGAKMTQNL